MAEHGRLALYITVRAYKEETPGGTKKHLDSRELFLYSTGTNYLMSYSNSSGTEVYSEIEVTPKKIDIKKSIGRHNTIEVQLKIVVKDSNVPTLNDFKSHFMDKAVEVHLQDEKEDSSKTPPTKQWTDEFAVAENYRVMGVRPELTNGTDKTFYVNLDIVSCDVLMDMTPYSRAYTARKLGENILKGIVSAYSSYGLSCDVSAMRVLQITSPSKLELRLPYVVQYNETEYSFILRTANRCGEFLFFEGGKLVLGLKTPSTEKTGTETTSEDDNVSDMTEYVSIKSVALSSPKDSAVAYAHGAVHDSGTAGEKTYLAEYANDDWFSVIQKDMYDSVSDRKGEMNPPNWSRILSQVFQYVNLVSSTFDIGFSEATLQNFCKGFSDGENLKISGKHFYYSDCITDEKESKKVMDIIRETSAPGKMDVDSKWQYAKNGGKWLHTQFTDFYTTKGNDSGIAVPNKKNDIDTTTDQTSYGGVIPSTVKRPITSAFYEMYKEEKEVERQQYKITFNSCLYGYKLGDVVTVKAIDSTARFVVVAVETQDYEENSKEVQKMTVTVISAKYTAASGSASASYKPVPIPAGVDITRRVGPMTAVVTDSDDPLRLGRVRVRFHWQKEGSDSTPWIRVVTPFATKDDSGMQFNLIKNDEVMVGFESENVECPYVVGALYNRTNTPPFGQRDYSMVLRSRNGHTIGFMDTANAGTILKSFIPGLKYLQFIPPIAKMKIGTDKLSTLRGMGKIDITDYYGMYSIRCCSDQRSINIDSPFGTVSMSAAMGITVSAPNGNVKIVGKNVDIVAGNNLTLKSGTNIDNALITSSFSTGSSFIGSLKKEGTALLDKIPGLFDLPALRFALELVIKPIAGTLKVHSGRYLIMESGDGNAVIPPSAFNEPHKTVYGNRYGDIDVLIYRIELLKSYVDKYATAYVGNIREICRLKRDIKNLINSVPRKHISLNDDNILSFITNSHNGAGEIGEAEVAKFVFCGNANSAENVEDNNDKKNARKIFNELKKLKAKVADFRTIGNGDKRKWEPVIPKDLPVVEGGHPFNILNLAREMVSYPFGGDGDENIYNFNMSLVLKVNNGHYVYGDIFNMGEDQNFGKKNRILVVKCLEAYHNGMLVIPQYNDDTFSTAEAYNEFVDSITINQDHNLTSHWFRDPLREMGIKMREALIPYDIKNVVAWGKNSKGSILLSQEKGHTITIDSNGLVQCENTLSNLKDTIKGIVRTRLE